MLLWEVMRVRRSAGFEKEMNLDSQFSRIFALREQLHQQSTWTGTIAPKTGQTIDYKGSAEGLEINGTEYKFAKGRVFLVSTKEETFTVSQLKVPIGDTNYDAELDRIIETADVQAFLRK